MAPKGARKAGKTDGSAQQHDPTRALAFLLRGSKGPEARSARLEENRVDYFRGKDLFRLMRAQPDLIDEYARQVPGVPTFANPSEKDRDAQITALGQRLLQQGYFIRCDRVYKTPRPGRTKRVKFPKFLEAVPRNLQQFTADGEGFYSWRGHPSIRSSDPWDGRRTVRARRRACARLVFVRRPSATRRTLGTSFCDA